MADHHDPNQVKADKANADRGICPECLRQLQPGAGETHAAEHYSQFVNPQPHFMQMNPNSDAARRFRLIKGI